MKYHYRFLRTIGGRSFFAQVGLKVQPGGDTFEVVDALPEKPNAAEGEVNRHTAPGWVSAAVEGIEAALRHAHDTGALANGCRVLLNELVGTLADTREDVIRCAAGLAVWNALGSPDFAPEAEFDGQKWNLVFPTPVPSPLHGVSQS